MTSQSEHLTPGELAGFLDRELGAAELVRVEGHLDTCEVCRRELALVARLAQDYSPSHAGHRPPGRRWLPLILTGALAAGLGGIVLLRRNVNSSRSVEQPVRSAAAGEGRARIETVAPADNGSIPPGRIRFVWHGLSTDLYRITLVTESAEPIWTSETVDTSVVLPDSIPLVRGHPYFWHVDAISAGISASTGSHRFLVAP